MIFSNGQTLPLRKSNPCFFPIAEAEKPRPALLMPSPVPQKPKMATSSCSDSTHFVEHHGQQTYRIYGIISVVPKFF